MTEEIFKTILNKENTLTYIGFDDIKNNEDFQINRKLLEESFDEFKTCCQWIERHKVKMKRRDFKNFNFLKYHFNSYFLTRSIEKWSGHHISNGAFIAALIYFDISYKPIYGSPDISVFLALDKETPYI
jgi:hypothetical protein